MMVFGVSIRSSNIIKNTDRLFFITLMILVSNGYSQQIYAQKNSVAEDRAVSQQHQMRYTVGPEDVLEISVWKEEDLKRDVLIRPDGRFSFPLVGELSALYKTPEQLQIEITQRLSKFIPDPVVTILVKKVASYKIYVLGQVKKAGQFVVGRYLDVIQALALAGGLTPFASENNIKVLRRNKNGQEIVIQVQYGAFKKGKNLNQNVNLLSGDIIIVP